ncbi:hypothetical protein HVTV-2_gp104 [Haloarcula virus HVTV-2]|uniref:Uncharacterized protein n=1 Tax=Haloarcula vallismortis tailed virus 1 TaxID=1262528 RepID=L7TJB0_9CAUD|nr:hypothetical protein HVTV1_104 [Haloarcula vallismortis tailed virus 1]AGC34473.1 hypothetical protein HVTV1_104 [Haloarcula vallismortis tailed virus 1]UBF22911.1 hypothetical protein HVTV-2_gp104 [Haloarcula virus HVTV-2]
MTDVAQELQKIADDTGKDVSDLKERYQNKLQDAKENAEDDLNEDAIKSFAVRMVRSEIMRQDRTSSFQGEVEEVPTLALGHGGVRRWGRNNPNTEERDVLFAYGIVNPHDSPVGIGVFIFDETDGVDLGDMKAKFRPLNELKVWTSIEEGDVKATGDPEPTPIYVCWSSDKTKAEEGDFDDLPSSKEGKRKVINNQIEDAATLADLGDHLSVGDSDDFSHEGDLKRISGYVVDHYQGESKNGNPFGIYNILDDTVVDPNDLREEITGGDDRNAGLTCWTQPDLMEYGNDSQCDFYGTITREDSGDNKGQIQMNVVGIVPYISMPIDDNYGNNGGNDDDDHGTETQSL